MGEREANGVSGNKVALADWDEKDDDRAKLITEKESSFSTDHIGDGEVSVVLKDSETTASKREREHEKCSSPRTPFLVYVIAFFSIIGGFLFGYDTGVIAGALLELDEDFPLDNTKKELIVSITVAAAAIGAVGGGPLNELLGRRRAIMVASVVFTVGAMLMAAAPTASWGWSIVLVGRFVVGLGIGKCS